MPVLTAKQLERKRKEDKTTKVPPATTEAEPATIDIRARQSEIEKEAEKAKATVREVVHKERRGRELPFKPGRTPGTAKLVTDIEKSRKEAQVKGKVVSKAVGKILAEREKQLQRIAKYKSGEGYDLVAMMQDGYTHKQLTELGFGKEPITKAQGRVNEIAKAEKYKGDAGYDLVAMVDAGYTKSQLESLFGGDATQNAITRADIIKRADKYKTGDGYDVAAMVRDKFSQSDMALLFDSDTITHATELVKADKYKAETGHDLLAMFGDGYTTKQLKDMGFDREAVLGAFDYYTALETMKPYQNTDGTYNIGKIADAVDKGKLTEDTVDRVLGENPVPYLTVKQVAAIRFYPTAEAYKLGAEWGITDEQVERIRTATTEDRARLFAYLRGTAEGITGSTVIQLPEFETQAQWKILATAMKDIEPYQTTEGQYDVAKAYEAMVAGKLAKESFIVAFGTKTYKSTKAFYDTNVEIKPGAWVAKADWKGLTPEQQKEVIATGKFTTIDTAGLVKLSTGEYVASEDWNKLDATAQAYLKKHGVDKFNTEHTVEASEPSQGWFKDTWNGIKAAMVVTDKTKENATVYCDSLGVTNEKAIDVVAQWIQISRVFLPRAEADPKADPKGYLIETGKALACYAPLVWVVNWKDMSTTDKIINGALDALVFVTLGLGAGVRALKAKPILSAAKAAGRAATNMDDTLRILAKTPVDDVTRYTKASSTASKAIEASKVADAKFVAALERVKALTPRQLTSLERASGIKGLKGAILDVGKAQTALNKAWKSLPTTTLQTMGGKDYITRMARVERAQTALNKALANFNTRLEPRFKVNPTPEFKGFAVDWHKKVLPYLEGGEPVVRPLGGGKGVQLAVLEKTKPQLKFKTFYEMKMKPVYETAKKAGRKAVAVPVVKGSRVAKTVVAASTVGKGLTQVERAIEEHTTIAIGTVLKAVTGKNQPVTAKEWSTHVAIRQITQDAVRTGLDASTRNVPSNQLQDLVQTEVAQGVRSITDAQLRTQLLPQAKTITRLVTKLVTRITTKYPERARAIKGKPLPRPRVKLPEAQTDKKGRPIYPKGTVVFKMGKLKHGGEYKAMLPPYDQARLISSKRPPVGMKRTEGTPQETLTFIGGKVPFADVSADLGITDVFIDTKRKKIRFGGKGLQTDVGKRIKGPTRGVSLANNAIRTTRHGQIFVTKVKGSKGVLLSRHNPNQRKRSQ